MVTKLLVGITVILVSVSCVAQVAPATNANHAPFSASLGGGMDYMSGDWQKGDINRWGPSAWATLTIWHDLSVIAEGHSMIIGGNNIAQDYKYFTGGGGLIYTSGYWGRFQPFGKGEAGFASLSQPGNGTGHMHQSSNIWTLGGGFEYHTWKSMWTRVEYDYDFFPNFHSSVTGQNHTLNPRGFIFGETWRFGPNGSKF
jgi:opacity protein-like surface antigen